MSQAVQITLIICGTIIFVQILGFSMIKSLWNKNNKPKGGRNADRFGYCKNPTYQRTGIIKPPKQGSIIKEEVNK